MIDPRRHVAPGQSLSLAAAQVNWINEQMRRSPAAAPRGGDFSAPYTWVYVRNSSGAAVTRWGILAITGVEIAPTYTTVADRATNQFQAMPVLTGGTPTVTTTAWCVAIEPIAAGKVGKAAVSGVVQCKVDVASTGDTLVKCKASTSELQTGSSGEGLVLWKDAGTGTGKWALVRLGAGGGGGHGFRLGQFSGQWPNEPGAYGSGNVKVVTLYTMRTPQNNSNDYIPELDSNGDNVTAVTLNLFSHIPTQTAGDMPLWCLVMPFGGPGQYVSGYSYNEETESYDIPIYTDYSTLWLLVAAEC